MNERIKELIAKSTRTVDGRADMFSIAREIFDIEKFAELIVNECALQCDHNEDMDNILEHFGVK